MTVKAHWSLRVAVACVTAAGLLCGIMYVAGGFSTLADVHHCPESVHAAEAKVRTDRWDPPEELPDLGDYPEIHWQLRAQGNPCSLAPGPTDWAYQGVVRLHPQDARTLAERYGFVPFRSIDPGELPHDHKPDDAWPALMPFLPAQSRWLHSTAYNESYPSTRWRVAFLDVQHHTLVFMLNDH